MSQDERFDGLFMTGVQQAQGIEPFFDALFSFFARKTDFFSKETQALTIVNRFMTKHIGQFKENEQLQAELKKKQEEAAAKAKAEAAAKQAAAAKAAQEKTAAAAEADDDAQCMEVTDEEAARIEAEEAAKKAGTTIDTTTAAASAETPAAEGEEEKKEGEEDDADKGALPNSGNGGQTDLYNWEQSLQEVTVNINIPQNVTGRQLLVDYTKTHLKVGVKGQPLLIDGDFFKQIKVDDSLWSIIKDGNGSRVLQLNLTKQEGQSWWDCVIQGDEKINTQKCEPENSKLSDLDGDTRSVVEKMMYDQRQKQMGLPTSEEQEKRSKLQAFMDAHPEMDFSKAKFS